MKTVIIYYSKTGFTRRYANWLADALECPAIPLHEVRPEDFEPAEIVIFASWFHAGNIQKLSWFKEQKLDHKRRAVLATGAMPDGTDALKAAFDNNFKDDKKDYALFYAQGGLNYEKMSFGDKLMMKMFVSMMNKKKDKSAEDQEMCKMIGKSFDCSSKEYLEPVIRWVKEENHSFN